MWALFAISAAFLWSITNTIDKLVLTRWVRKPLVPIIMTGMVWMIVIAVVFSLNGFSHLSGTNILLAVLTGILTILLYICYFKAMQMEEASRIAPLFYLEPLFIAVLAAIFLGEIFSPLKYLGIFLIIVGAILISTKKISKITVGKAFWWMVLSAVLGAVSAVLTKHLLDLSDFWTIFSYKGVGMVVGAGTISIFFFSDFMETIKRHGKKAVIAMSTSEVLSVTGSLFSIIAISIGYVTLANTLSSVQPFFVLPIMIFLSIFFPHILKEEINKSTILLKILAIVLMFAGVIIIT